MCRYGRVFKSHLFGSPTIISCELELNTFILQNEGRLFQSSYPKPVKSILGDLSLMIVHGELHKKLRSVEVEFINSFKSRPDFIAHIQKLSASLMESWAGKQQIHLFKEAKAFSFNVMLKCLFDMAPGDPLAVKLFQHFLTFMEGFVSLPLNLPGTTFAKAMKVWLIWAIIIIKELITTNVQLYYNQFGAGSEKGSVHFKRYTKTRGKEKQWRLRWQRLLLRGGDCEECLFERWGESKRSVWPSACRLWNHLWTYSPRCIFSRSDAACPSTTKGR